MAALLLKSSQQNLLSKTTNSPISLWIMKNKRNQLKKQKKNGGKSLILILFKGILKFWFKCLTKEVFGDLTLKLARDLLILEKKAKQNASWSLNQ
jgi:hypothetical protein